MPEGDTIHQAAARLRPALIGKRVVRLSGSHPGLRTDARRIAGASVTAVESTGKHLLVDFDNGWTLRTHLGMPGRWNVYRPGERWGRTPGKARVVLEADDAIAVCFSAPTVELAPADVARRSIEHLGPDLMDDAPDWAAIVTRALESSSETAADLLLDQRVMAGIGNVFKSEVLFLEGVDPQTPVRDLAAEQIEMLARRGHRLLRANRRPGARSTTGTRRAGGETWVYGRGGRPCRRCGTSIRSSSHGDLDRVTYWCPRCQPSTGG